MHVWLCARAFCLPLQFLVCHPLLDHPVNRKSLIITVRYAERTALCQLRAVTTKIQIRKNTLTKSPFKPGRPLSPYKSHIIITCIMIYNSNIFTLNIFTHRQTYSLSSSSWNSRYSLIDKKQCIWKFTAALIFFYISFKQWFSVCTWA